MALLYGENTNQCPQGEQGLESAGAGIDSLDLVAEVVAGEVRGAGAQGKGALEQEDGRVRVRDLEVGDEEMSAVRAAEASGAESAARQESYVGVYTSQPLAINPT